MNYVIIRRPAKEKERDEVYNDMFEGRPRTTLTLGTRAARLEKDMAELCAKQLNGMFPGHKWEAIPEAEFKYKTTA